LRLAALWILLFVAINVWLPVIVACDDILLLLFGAVAMLLLNKYLLEGCCHWACSAHSASWSAVVVVMVKALHHHMWKPDKLFWLLEESFVVVWISSPLR